jgi:uncharacterized protein (TIGR03083 family)
LTHAAADAAAAGWRDLCAVVDALADEDWAAPSGCAGWRVQDVVAHLGANLHHVVAPAPPPPAGLGAEVVQEHYVAARRHWSPAEVRAELDTYGDAAIERLRALQHEPLASKPLRLGDLGQYQLHQLADAYAFDLYCHVRNDLPTGRALAPAETATLGAVVGWMLAGLPQMCGADLPEIGPPIVLVLTGPGSGAWKIERHHVARLTSPPPPHAVVVASTADDFVRWGTRRADWRASCTVTGDAALAAAVLDAVNIV